MVFSVGFTCLYVAAVILLELRSTMASPSTMYNLVSCFLRSHVAVANLPLCDLRLVAESLLQSAEGIFLVDDQISMIHKAFT